VSEGKVIVVVEMLQWLAEWQATRH